jgi:TonB family protein
MSAQLAAGRLCCTQTQRTGSRPLDLSPAPLFLLKRHFKQRMVLILKETRMSKIRLISALTAGIALLAAASWLVIGAFPLMASPQIANDPPGVTVDLRGAALLHRSAVPYPLPALQQKVQGTIAVEVKLDAKGTVSDARILSGPDELRKTTLESVLQWHFARYAAGSTRVV